MTRGLLLLLVLLAAWGAEVEARFFEPASLLVVEEESPWVEYIENEPDCNW